jgi:NAD(P)-dependent dehydrogenase (short-subunit alcohol dehydrogenase family)
MSESRVGTKVVAIVGASGGIGQAIAARLAQDAAVTLGYRSNKETAEDLAKSIIRDGGKAVVAQVDVSSSIRC